MMDRERHSFVWLLKQDGKQECSFLKKRTKKLLLFGCAAWEMWVLVKLRLFAFFAKKEEIPFARYLIAGLIASRLRIGQSNATDG